MESILEVTSEALEVQSNTKDPLRARIIGKRVRCILKRQEESKFTIDKWQINAWINKIHISELTKQ